MQIKDRVVAKVIDECLKRKIDQENVDLGCDHAEFLLEKKVQVAECIKSGIHMAEYLQGLS